MPERETGVAPDLFRDIDSVVHVAGLAHSPATDGLEAHRRINRDLAIGCAEAAAAAGVRRFVFVSSIAVHGRHAGDRALTAASPIAPTTPYGQAKAEAEAALWQIAARTGLEVSVVRPPLVCGAHAPGNLGKLATAIRRGVPLPLKSVDNRRTLIEVEDLAALLIACADRPAAVGQAFLAGDPEAVSTPDIVRAIARGLGQRPRLFNCPVRALERVGDLSGRGGFVRQLTRSLELDVSPTLAALGWTPTNGVREGLTHTGRGSIAK